MKRAQIENLLRDNGFKLSRARALIIEAICGGLRRPFSVDKAVDYISERYRPPCDRASVYRNFKLFERLEILRVCGVFRETTYYDFSTSTYIVCRHCGHMDDITNSVTVKLSEEFYALKYGSVHRRIEFQGLCPQCNTK